MINKLTGRAIKPNKTAVKLYNASVKRKENLAIPKVNLSSPLLDVATWHSSWQPAQFASLTALRAYVVADWVRRLVTHNGSLFQLVASPAQANLNLIELDAPPRGQFCLEVAPFISGVDGDQKPLPVPAEQNFALDVVRYYIMSTNYRIPLQWNRAALEAAQAALERLRQYAVRFEAESKTKTKDDSLVADKVSNVPTMGEWRNRFYSSLNDDLNLTRALAVIWTLLQNPLAVTSKLALLREFDQLLGLRLTSFYEQDSQTQTRNVPLQQPKPVKPGRPLKPAPSAKVAAPVQATRRLINSTRDVRSLLDEPDKFDFTVSLIAYHNLAATRQTLDSVLYYTARASHKVEIIVADLGGDPALTDYLEGLAARYNNFRIIYANPERFLGEAAGHNLALRQGRGKYLLLLDAGLVLQGDVFEALFAILEKTNRAALHGFYPLKLQRQDGKIVGSEPLEQVSSQGELFEAEALSGELLCFRRNLVDEVGFMDERFRYPFALDLDYSFAFKTKGFGVLALPHLASMLKPSAHQRPTYNLAAAELERQVQKNWQLFLKSWDL